MSTCFILNPDGPAEEVQKLKFLWTVNVAKQNSTSSFSCWNFRPPLWRLILQRTFGRRKKARLGLLGQFLQPDKCFIRKIIIICELIFLFFHRARGCALVSQENLGARQMLAQSSHVWFRAGCRSPSKYMWFFHLYMPCSVPYMSCAATLQVKKFTIHSPELSRFSNDKASEYIHVDWKQIRRIACPHRIYFWKSWAEEEIQNLGGICL